MVVRLRVRVNGRILHAPEFMTVGEDAIRDQDTIGGPFTRPGHKRRRNLEIE